MRQQRNLEARELIGSRVGTAKAIFSQNSASGQMQTNNKVAPVKPIRNTIQQRFAPQQLDSGADRNDDNVENSVKENTVESVEKVAEEVVLDPANIQKFQNVINNGKVDNGTADRTEANVAQSEDVSIK